LINASSTLAADAARLGLVVQRAAARYEAILGAELGAELGASCAGDVDEGTAEGTLWLGLGAGSALLHLSAVVVAVLLFAQLGRQLYVRVRGSCGGCPACHASAHDGAATTGAGASWWAPRGTDDGAEPSQPLLDSGAVMGATSPRAQPTAASRGGWDAAPITAPWSTLALAELFLAAYAAQAMATRTTAAAAAAEAAAAAAAAPYDSSPPPSRGRWFAPPPPAPPPPPTSPALQALWRALRTLVLGDTGSLSHRWLLGCATLLLLAAALRTLQVR
jgi:hypothetical protein